MRHVLQFVFLGLITIQSAWSDGSAESPLHYRVARVLRPSIREDERMLREMVEQREILPPLTPGRRVD